MFARGRRCRPQSEAQGARAIIRRVKKAVEFACLDDAQPFLNEAATPGIRRRIAHGAEIPSKPRRRVFGGAPEAMSI